MKAIVVLLFTVYGLQFTNGISAASVKIPSESTVNSKLSTVNNKPSTANKLLPCADDAFWRDSIPEEMRRSYISYGEQFAGKGWTVLPWTVFSENKKTGNRVNYEAVCFEKRRQFAAVVMAEIMEGKGRFMNNIIDGIGSFCEETWWGIPAHYGKAIPLTELQEVDLFNAETANLIAWTRYMFQKQFDEFSPNLCQRIDREIERRILQPALEKNYWWKTAGMNWNPWICSNWLSCVLICEKDETSKAEAIRQIKQATQTFIDAYPEDGGCDEGPAYWDRAAASMFEILNLLTIDGQIPCMPTMTSGKPMRIDNHPDNTEGLVSITNVNKIRNMASYCYKTYIGNDYCVCFADAHENKAVQQVNIVYPFGRFLNDQTMREFGAYLGQQKGILTNPAQLYDKSGNFPTLSRELFFLRHIHDFITEKPHEPLLKDVWLPDLQIMTARRDCPKTATCPAQNLYIAMKGGTNGESHNHNDVGSFIVYVDGQPLFIDPAVGEYTAKTFGKDRYDIWTMQSQYHNLAQINGRDQKDGKEYAAKVVSHKNGLLTLDIAGAYPAEAKVKSWKRTVAAVKSGISITEDYELHDFVTPARLSFICLDPSALQRIHYDANQLSAEVEDISDYLDPVLRHMWGPKMYRIILTVKSAETKNRIKYIIR